MRNEEEKIKSDKSEFIEYLKNRTKKFVVDTITFCETLKKGKASDVIIYQLIKSVTSTAANYRSACRGRFKADFYSKLCIAVEEVDQSVYCSDTNLSKDLGELKKLKTEAYEVN